MKIYITGVFVDDQDKAEAFYTKILGFQIKHDVPVGEFRWLTLVSPDAPDGPELLLEPSAHAAVPPYKSALVSDGIPAHSFQVDNLDEEWQRLKALDVKFTVDPMDAGPVRMAIFDDTCGNLIQLVEMVAGA